MSSTLTFTGTMAAPIAPGGPTASLYVGSPSVTPSTDAYSDTYEEQACGIYSIVTADGAVDVNFGTVDSGDFVYLGADNPVTVEVNSGTFLVAAEGFLIFAKAALTAMTVLATSSNTTVVTVAIYGD